MIQKALDDIHLEADMRDAGSAVKLEATTSALEELLTQLDASGFVKGEVHGALWDFKRDGILPFERDSVPAGERAPVNEVGVEQMKGELIDEEVAVAVEGSDITEEWQELSTPAEETTESVEEVAAASHEDERATLEEELARLDARWARRTDPVESGVVTDSTLDELEDSLDGIDL